MYSSWICCAWYVHGRNWNVTFNSTGCVSLDGGETVSAADSAFGMSGSMCAIWFGILVVKMAEFCLITHLNRISCFVVAGVRDDLSVQDVFKGVTPFFIADGFTIAILISFPAMFFGLCLRKFFI